MNNYHCMIVLILAPHACALLIPSPRRQWVGIFARFLVRSHACHNSNGLPSQLNTELLIPSDTAHTVGSPLARAIGNGKHPSPYSLERASACPTILVLESLPGEGRHQVTHEDDVCRRQMNV
jgi:hypothetical protein